MSDRRLPVRPNLAQLKHQAKDLLRTVREGTPASVAAFRAHHPGRLDPSSAKLSDAQLVIARQYEASSWTRLVQAVDLVNAIWADDLETVRALVSANPRLLHDPALIRTDSHWGPPLTYAANLGRDRIIELLHRLGATDLHSALDRAALQGRIGTARLLHRMLGSPVPPDGALAGPAYTLSESGTALLLELGARVRDETGQLRAPASVVLQTDGRHPAAKHAILAMYEAHGLVLPDSAPMAVHRGRVDLLEAHLARDPGLLGRTFSHREIYPAELGCGEALEAVVGTPLEGTTLLHMAVEYDETEIVRWLLDQGMDVNARGRIGASGFGGWTALFSTVVSLPNFWMNYERRGPWVAPMTELLLAHGANPNLRASIWKRLGPGHGETTRHEYRDVTALSWGRRFHAPVFVSEPALALIVAAGGVE